MFNVDNQWKKVNKAKIYW